MKKILIALIKFYRKFISPMKGTKCPYIPTCSEYGLQAIEKYGAKKLIVDKKNEVAIRLYKKFGFKIMGDNGKYTSQYFMLLESEIK